MDELVSVALKKENEKNKVNLYRLVTIHTTRKIITDTMVSFIHDHSYCAKSSLALPADQKARRLGTSTGLSHTWVEFVVGSLLCTEVFLQVFRFSPLLNNQQFQIPIRPGLADEESLRMCYLQIAINCMYVGT